MTKTVKNTLFTALALAAVAMLMDSCAMDRRWYSTYKDEKTGEKKTEHYNGYTKRWYKRNWNNGRMWK